MQVLDDGDPEQAPDSKATGAHHDVAAQDHVGPVPESRAQRASVDSRDCAPPPSRGANTLDFKGLPAVERRCSLGVQGHHARPKVLEMLHDAVDEDLDPAPFRREVRRKDQDSGAGIHGRSVDSA